ncbi:MULTISPECIES: chromate transporter [unclassified Mycoplasma]|uniref:chromate transporter n=1 Tax=unclassified Mycoplasma TaxID=2683645 RepID=UPI00216B3B5C|nr:MULTISPECIES: chromate transporter [unclassified Mycoplasma]MCS4536966.1 chromate transporter [Mycoplasma sp. CSL7475-4]MCT4469496.1 chromate transporter [Mycoplasma sp. HS2188]
MIKNKKKKPTFWNVFVLILMVTFIGFGGGNALMPVIKRYVVDKYEWLDNEEFDKNVVITNMLPGPMAIQALSYVAIKALGFWKGTIVVVLASIPHVVLAVCLIFLVNKLDKRYLMIIQTGVLVAIVGSLIGFAWNYFRKGIKESRISLWLILFISTFAFSLFIPTPWNVPVAIMVLIIAIFTTVFFIKKRKNITNKKKGKDGAK